MAEKEVELSIKFKEAVLEKGDVDFQAILDDAVGAIKSRLADARAQYNATKAAVVVGVPTLEEKGVEIGVTVRF